MPVDIFLPRGVVFQAGPAGAPLPIAREIVEAYVRDDVKLPWYIDLLNINLETHDLTEAKRRTRLLAEAFRKDGTRITENLDFGRQRSKA